MIAFLETANLEVKYRLLCVKKCSRYCYLSSPKFYILSFQNVGVEDINVSAPKDDKSYPEIKAHLSFY